VDYFFKWGLTPDTIWTEVPAGVGGGFPVIKLPSGLMLAQTATILFALGEDFALAGKSPESKLMSLQYLQDLDDVSGLGSEPVQIRSTDLSGRARLTAVSAYDSSSTCAGLARFSRTRCS
jgi:hypothetical protein